MHLTLNIENFNSATGLSENKYKQSTSDITDTVLHKE